MIFQVLRDTVINYVLRYFAAYRGERYGPVVGSKAFRTFLVKRKNIAMAPLAGTWPSWRLWLKMEVSTEQWSYFKANLF